MPRKRDVIPRPDVFRQSLLASWETCPRRTRFALQSPDDLAIGWVQSTGDLGTAFHAIAAEMARAIWAHGEPGGQKMPTQEAMEIGRETYRKLGIVLPTADRHALRQMVLRWCSYPWVPGSILAIEQRLTLDILCEDGVTRTLKGQPDLILSDPPDGIVILDYKTSKGKPSAPRGSNPEPGEIVEGKSYLSDRGHYQLDTYGLLALKGTLDDGTRLVPSATRATLRELHLRSGHIRQASLQTGGEQDDLEHVLTDIRDHMQMLDEAIAAGPKSPLFKPRPGSHCHRKCPVARSCPVPPEQRGIGALSTQAQADREAEIFAAWEAKHDQARERLKAWEENGNPPGRPNSREEVRWGPEPDAWMTKGGGRGFKIWPAVNGNGNGEAP